MPTLLDIACLTNLAAVCIGRKSFTGGMIVAQIFIFALKVVISKANDELFNRIRVRFGSHTKGLKWLAIDWTAFFIIVLIAEALVFLFGAK